MKVMVLKPLPLPAKLNALLSIIHATTVAMNTILIICASAKTDRGGLAPGLLDPRCSLLLKELSSWRTVVSSLTAFALWAREASVVDPEPYIWIITSTAT